MEAKPLQKGAKREMIVTAFAHQFDEVDRALFEYRSRKQNHYGHANLHANSNNNKRQAQRHHHHSNHQNHNHYHNSQHQHQQYQYHHQQQVQQQPQYYKTANNNAVYGMNPQHLVQSSARSSPAPPTLVQQQVYPQQQLSMQPVPQQAQPQMMVSGTSMVAPQQPVGYGSAVVARSPDSFIEGIHAGTKFDGFSLNLSSSISSGAGSTSSYSSMGEYDMQNKLAVGGGYTSHSSLLGHGGFNKMTVGTNEINVINEDHVFDEFGTTASSTANNTTTSNRGWLNIWGNDMSVWG